MTNFIVTIMMVMGAVVVTNVLTGVNCYGVCCCFLNTEHVFLADYKIASGRSYYLVHNPSRRKYSSGLPP